MYKYSVLVDNKHADRIKLDTPYFRIDEGPFAGVEYIYTDIRPKVVDGQRVIAWKFGLLFSPLTKANAVEFRTALQDILDHAITEAMEGEEISEIDDIPFLDDEPVDPEVQARVDELIEREPIPEEIL